MGPPKGLSALARSTSTWIHWWSPVDSANSWMRSWSTTTQSVGPSSVPTRSRRSAGVGTDSVMSAFGDGGRRGRGRRPGGLGHRGGEVVDALLALGVELHRDVGVARIVVRLGEQAG